MATVKEEVVSLIKRLPEDATIVEIIIHKWVQMRRHR